MPELFEISPIMLSKLNIYMIYLKFNETGNISGNLPTYHVNYFATKIITLFELSMYF